MVRIIEICTCIRRSIINIQYRRLQTYIRLNIAIIQVKKRGRLDDAIILQLSYLSSISNLIRIPIQKYAICLNIDSDV